MQMKSCSHHSSPRKKALSVGASLAKNYQHSLKMAKLSRLAYFVIVYAISGWLILPVVWMRTLFWLVNLTILVSTGAYSTIHIGTSYLNNQPKSF
jgi:hypothetical protein